MRLAIESLLLQLENVVEHFRHENRNRLLRFAVKAQRLAGDVANALQFFLGQIGERRASSLKRRMIAQQIKNVGDGGQRIIDFVRDDPGHAPHRCQLFSFAKRLFSAQLGGNIAIHFEHRIPTLIRRFEAIHDDLFAAPGGLRHAAMPRAMQAQMFFDFFTRRRENGLQQRVQLLAHRFLSRASRRPVLRRNSSSEYRLRGRVR